MVYDKSTQPSQSGILRRAFVLSFGVAPPLLSTTEAPSLPAIELETNVKRRLRLADWEDKLVIANFWATWCVPCRREMTELQRFLDRTKEHAAGIGLAVDQMGWPVVTPFVRQYGIRFPIALAERNVLRAFGLRSPLPSVPQTLVFGPKGKLVLHATTALGASDFDVIARNVSH